ncbi:MAG: DMT family transporter [Candidatus Pacebacteria bacterium]|jgi:drug/metabolite transporter (DMT)-like permease|nr:DMT family transporter [Candidatus Paceibacterota bacterium]MBT3512288.1 DMT family transporter [Candidatus Paceibacterota bacterium]MBT4004518.1 DMT family transporter [Candidatus Paceibacterota bacterium]MBT6898694.1 DMT family transporter [Candidatus Paceibacterota bacterium]MBT7183427.1 DMT family transporter [Candidatus Paceibacterota bacterium]
MIDMSLKKHHFFSQGPILIVLAAALWALDGIIRRSLYHLSPVVIVFYEHLIGSLILLPIVVQTLKKEKLTGKVLFNASIVALLGGLLGTLFITSALIKVHFIAFSVVFLIQKLQPLFAAGSAHLLLGEKLTPQYIKWAILALTAAFFVTFPNGNVNLDSGSGTLVAALFALGAAVCWGISTTLSKSLLNTVSHQGGTILRFYLSTLWALIAVYVLGQSAALMTVGTFELSRLVYIALTTGLLAMWIYYKGLKKTEAKVSTILELTFPLLAVFIDMVLYKTFLKPTQYLAAAVLMFAIYRVGKLQNSSSK